MKNHTKQKKETMLVMQFLVVDFYARFWTYELLIQTVFEHIKTGKKSLYFPEQFENLEKLLTAS